jgi:enoyl-CoA hydratase
MSYENILYEVKERIAHITINRPDKLNVLSHQTMRDLKDALTTVKSDNAVDVVILTGSGEKAFVAGADIRELNELDLLTGREFAERGQEIFNLVENLGKPVIAAINGYAVGGGSELAMACHIRIAAEHAKFRQPEVNLGIIPGYGGTQRLARLVGKGRAVELILTGNQIDAQEAYRIGLVNKVVPLSELIPTCEAIARTIQTKAQIAVRLALKAVNMAHETDLSEGQHLEATLFGVCCGTQDFKEGTSAFLEKRKPEFKNR